MEQWYTPIFDWLSGHGIQILIVLVGVSIAQVVIERLIKRGMHHIVRRIQHEEAQEGVREAALGKREDTLNSIAISSLRVVLWLTAILMILSEIGINIGPLIATAGVAGLAFGFGGQYLIRDLISGLFIIIENHYRKGDVVKIAGIGGLVEDINLRRTVLRDLDGVQHYIPNGEIKTSSNMSKYWSRLNLDIGVAYETNLDYAIQVLNQIGQDMMNDGTWKNDLIEAPKVLGVEQFADSAIILKVLGDTKPLRQWDVMREYRKRVKSEFDKASIEIPFPQRTISYKNLAQ
ncbi:MAG: mechanosensitive ion channel family protein [Candidatus Nomurabacteria bacterium]|nr:MAG: mechanosensitive ion channel family protein [Candidatus Nomurabacteria bacterium]